MKNEPAPTSIGPAGQLIHTRVLSLDIFRGITMAVMIFVNDLSSVHGLSKWTYHMPANVDAMTYVDMVFPAFLFIVGMSLPLAIGQRLKRNPSLISLWFHVLLRSAALLTIGLILANAELGDEHRMGISQNAWALLALTGVFLLWCIYSPRFSQRVVLVCRGCGFMVIATMFALFRRSAPDGTVRWINFSYPEILGLIGVTYFAVCLLYIPLRKYRWAPLGCFSGLIAFNCACSAKWISLQHVSLYAWPFDNGAMAAIAMAGIVTSGIFLEHDRWATQAAKIRVAMLFALALLAAGWALAPLGISKIRATPSWSLWSAGASCLLFTALYWLCDVRHYTRWAALFRSAGSNTLLTYLLPDFYFYLAGLLGLESLLGHWNAGPAGILRAVCFTMAMLLLASLLTARSVRLQL